MNSTFASTVAGTLKYIAPEIVLNRQYDYTCDVWSLGCIFYELCMLRLEGNFYMEV
jgi:serine/threonine protein kinase